MSPIVQQFLAWSQTSHLPQARRQWRLTHVEPHDDACMLCGRRSSLQYGITHRNGTVLTVDRACVLHFIYLPGVTPHRSKAAVLFSLTKKLRTRATLAELGEHALLGTLTPAQHATLVQTVARMCRWTGPVTVLMIQRVWPQIVQRLAGVPLDDLGTEDQARLWSVFAPAPQPLVPQRSVELIRSAG